MPHMLTVEAQRHPICCTSVPESSMTSSFQHNVRGYKVVEKSEMHRMASECQ